MKSPSVNKVDLRTSFDSFRNLNPNDIGAWPLAPRVAVLAALFVAVLGAGWWFAWSDELDTLEAKQQEELKLKDEFVDKKSRPLISIYILCNWLKLIVRLARC